VSAKPQAAGKVQRLFGFWGGNFLDLLGFFFCFAGNSFDFYAEVVELLLALVADDAEHRPGHHDSADENWPSHMD
jgi:hypothetical protein